MAQDMMSVYGVYGGCICFVSCLSCMCVCLVYLLINSYYAEHGFEREGAREGARE
jgi:hypothetical protein